MTAPCYEVRLTQGAGRDLADIHAYRAEQRGADDADALLDVLLEKVATLEQFPERGARPPELEALGIGDFRQILHLPYRLIYRVIGWEVFITIIADGRRDLQGLLARRLLGAP